MVAVIYEDKIWLSSKKKKKRERNHQLIRKEKTAIKNKETKLNSKGRINHIGTGEIKES